MYGEHGPLYRDVAARADLHHLAVRARAPPRAARVDARCPSTLMDWGPSATLAPFFHCAGLSHDSGHNLTVELAPLRDALADAFAIVGFRRLPCECARHSTCDVDSRTAIASAAFCGAAEPPA